MLVQYFDLSMLTFLSPDPDLVPDSSLCFNFAIRNPTLLRLMNECTRLDSSVRKNWWFTPKLQAPKAHCKTKHRFKPNCPHLLPVPSWTSTERCRNRMRLCLPSFDDEGKGGPHSGLRVAADIVAEAVVEPPPVRPKGLVPEGFVHAHVHQLQQPEPMFLRDPRSFHRQQIHLYLSQFFAPTSTSTRFSICRRYRFDGCWACELARSWNGESRG